MCISGRVHQGMDAPKDESNNEKKHDLFDCQKHSFFHRELFRRPWCRRPTARSKFKHVQFSITRPRCQTQSWNRPPVPRAVLRILPACRILFTARLYPVDIP